MAIEGDAPPAPRPVYSEPTPITPATGNSSEPKRRGRPPGSKNKATANAHQSPATGGKVFFGSKPLDERTATASARVIVTIYSVPCNLAARLRKNDDFQLTAEEKQQLMEAFRDYQMIRGDLLGEYAPEIMLLVTAGMPAYMRYLLWNDPTGAEGKEFQNNLTKMQGGNE